MSEKKTDMQTKKVQMNQSLKRLEELQKKNTANLSRNTATLKRKLANNLKRTLPEYKFAGLDNSSSNAQNRRIRYFEGSTQDYIPVKHIQDGMYLTKDNRYIGVIEVLPVGFYQKSVQGKLSIITSFREVFQNKHIRWMLKIMRDGGNSIDLIPHLLKNCPNQSDPVVKETLDNYIAYLKKLASSGTVSERYFFIWEYSGIDGVKSRDPEEVAQTMWENKCAIIDSLTDCGNICLRHDNENAFLGEVAYTFFNRKSSKIETIYDRYDRLNSDFDTFNKLTGMNKQLKYADLIAPKGLSTMNRNYLVMDGTYYGFIGLSSESWPTDIAAGWLDCLNYGANVDVDVIGKMLPHQLSLAALTQVSEIRSSGAKALLNRGNQRKGLPRLQKAQDVAEVAAKLNAGDDLYDVAIVLTVRANTPKQLRSSMRMINHHLKHKLHITPDSCYTCYEDYFRLTMPFLYTTPVFTRLKHNVLASKLAYFYPFTSLALSDPSGTILGQSSRQVISLNQFNTDFFENANMLILGSSGAGKSYTEKIIGERSYLNGKRCFFILPKKGYEYEECCKLVNGAYLKLMPSTSICINILEIRPEIDIDRSKIDDNISISGESLLAKKVNDVIIWLELLMGNTMSSHLSNQLNAIIYKMYNEFGITGDNDSIYANSTHSTLKPMPILSDLYNTIQAAESDEYETLSHDDATDILDALHPFIFGICKNMNGQTNIDLSNRMIVFDCNEDIIGEKWLAAFLYVAFTFVCGEVKASENTDDLIFLDEVWKMMKNAECAKQVQNLVKIIRGYRGGTVIATQEIGDFLRAQEDYGASVINCSSITLLMKMKEHDLKLVKENYQLTPEESDKLLKFKRGNGILFAAGDKIPLRIVSSEFEQSAFSDRTAKKKIS